MPKATIQITKKTLCFRLLMRLRMANNQVKLKHKYAMICASLSEFLTGNKSTPTLENDARLKTITNAVALKAIR